MDFSDNILLSANDPPTPVSVTDIKEKLFGNHETKTLSYYSKNVTHMTAI